MIDRFYAHSFIVHSCEVAGPHLAKSSYDGTEFYEMCHRIAQNTNTLCINGVRYYHRRAEKYIKSLPSMNNPSSPWTLKVLRLGAQMSLVDNANSHSFDPPSLHRLIIADCILSALEHSHQYIVTHRCGSTIRCLTLKICFYYNGRCQSYNHLLIN